MCLCTTPFASCVPTARAKTLGFIGGYYTISLFSLALIITGWCAVRDSSVYNIEQVLCVVFFSGYLWVYAVVDVILYIENYSDLSIFVLLALLGGIVFYAIACAVAKLLYDELRNNYLQPGPEDMPTGILGAFGGGGGGLRNFGGFGQNNNAQQTQIGSENEPLNQNRGQMGPNQNRSDRKFQAFQGQSNSLS